MISLGIINVHQRKSKVKEKTAKALQRSPFSEGLCGAFISL